MRANGTSPGKFRVGFNRKEKIFKLMSHTLTLQLFHFPSPLPHLHFLSHSFLLPIYIFFSLSRSRELFKGKEPFLIKKDCRAKKRRGNHPQKKNQNLTLLPSFVFPEGEPLTTSFSFWTLDFLEARLWWAWSKLLLLLLLLLLSPRTSDRIVILFSSSFTVIVFRSLFAIAPLISVPLRISQMILFSFSFFFFRLKHTQYIISAPFRVTSLFFLFSSLIFLKCIK